MSDPRERLAALLREVAATRVAVADARVKNRAPTFGEMADYLLSHGVSLASPRGSGEPDYKGFAEKVIREAWEGMDCGPLDGGDVQELGEKFGILKPVTVNEPCGDACMCAGYSEFPVICYRFVAPSGSSAEAVSPKCCEPRCPKCGDKNV